MKTHQRAMDRRRLLQCRSVNWFGEISCQQDKVRQYPKKSHTTRISGSQMDRHRDHGIFQHSKSLRQMILTEMKQKELNTNILSKSVFLNHEKQVLIVRVK
jgi:hypothetical protein